ncbi:MAG TPA: Gfo/Idh/MocA family oxidoreductase [Anaerolineales bacterium]|nr:Gfo/Idh/MocA family oxidoreductase [Anaerolineales bacterium]
MTPPSPITALLIGAGQRGADIYGRYARTHPDEIRFVAVAEPDPARRTRFATQHHIPPEHQFETWEPLLALPQLADAAFICTQDEQHTAPTLAALRAGYHVLLEKPMPPPKNAPYSYKRAKKPGGSCTSPTSCAIPRTLSNCAKSSNPARWVINVDHRENVAWWHMAHTSAATGGTAPNPAP